MERAPTDEAAGRTQRESRSRVQYDSETAAMCLSRRRGGADVHGGSGGRLYIDWRSLKMPARRVRSGMPCRANYLVAPARRMPARSGPRWGRSAKFVRRAPRQGTAVGGGRSLPSREHIPRRCWRRLSRSEQRARGRASRARLKLEGANSRGLRDEAHSVRGINRETKLWAEADDVVSLADD